MANEADSILEVAKGEIGVKELPPNSNKTKYGKAYGMNGVAWCAIFVWWVFNKAGLSDLLPIKTASCFALMTAAKTAGQWVTSGYKKGDVVIYTFSHTGIVESASGSKITAIEGNTGIGNDANGGQVMRRTRNLSVVRGAFRPAYSSVKKSDALIAQEVLDGLWNTGDKRKALLTSAGYNYETVRKIVNALAGSGWNVRVATSVGQNLNIRTGPNINSSSKSVLPRGKIVTVVQVKAGDGAKSGWGELKSGGWISLDYVTEA